MIKVRQLTWKGFGASLLVALVATVVVGWLAGHFSASQHESFNWDVAAVAATAFATISLVLVTGTLAYFTWQLAASTAGDVSASRELAEIARAEHRLATEPFLIEGAPAHVQKTAAMTKLSWKIELVNVGRGPALEVYCEVFRRHDDGSETANVSFSHFRIVKAGASVEALFETPNEPGFGDAAQWHVRGTYEDRDGNPTGRYFFGSSDSPRVRGEFRFPGAPRAE